MSLHNEGFWGEQEISTLILGSLVGQRSPIEQRARLAHQLEVGLGEMLQSCQLSIKGRDSLFC